MGRARSERTETRGSFVEHVSISCRDECLLGFNAFPLCVVKPGGRRPSGPDEGEFEVCPRLARRGYFDLALDYLEILRTAKDTPADLREVLDLEQGRLYLEDAARATDPDRQTVQFDRAKTKLEEFAKQHATHPRASEALVQIARLMVERGRLAAIDKKLTDARAAFDQARKAYDQAIEQRTKAYEMYRGRFFEKTDPKHDEQDKTHTALMEAQLSRAEVDYQEAITYPLKDAKRNELLDKAVAAFKDLYDKYRGWSGGFYAQMWQGKCLEEKDELGAAMGIYDQLLEHKDPSLRPIQRQVDYFRIIVYGKRKQFALASDECQRWIQANPAEARTETGLEVRLEMAKNLFAQTDDAGEGEKGALVRKAIDVLTEVGACRALSSPRRLSCFESSNPRRRSMPTRSPI